MSLLGLDIGTTGTKAVLFAESGQIIDSDYQDYAHIYPRPGWAELSAETVWGAVKKTINQVARKNGKSIRALSISCMGDNIIPIRRDGTPNYNGLLAFDTRSTEEVKMIGEAVGWENYFRTTGNHITTVSNICKMLWLKRHHPDIFQSTWKFMMFADYVLFRMGFTTQISQSQASLNILDIRNKVYPEAILQEFGMSSNHFSEPVPPDDIIGEVPLAARSELGLPAGVRVVMGGADLACGVLGSGVSPSTLGTVADVAGTWEHAAYISRRPILNKRAFRGDVICFCNVVRDSYVVFRGLPTAGGALKWFREEFAAEEKARAEREGRNVYDVMLEPLRFEGGQVMVHPYLAGRYGDSSAPASILGFTLATKKADILAGLVEGITHEYRFNLEVIEGLAGRRLEVVRAVGGMARSRKWLQLKADLTGRVVETVSITEASALGAALVAGVAIGAYKSFDEAIEGIVAVTDRFSPRPAVSEVYNRQHETYKKLVKMIHY